MTATQVMFAVTMMSLNLSLTAATWLAFRRLDTPMVRGGLHFGASYGVAVLLAVLAPALADAVARGGPNCMAVVAMGFLVSAFRQETGDRGAPHPRLVWTVTFAIGAMLLALGLSQAWDTARVALVSVALAAAQAWCLVLALRWRRQRRSRSVDLICAALLVVLASNLLRVAVTLTRDWRYSMYAGDTLSITVVTSFVCGFVLFYLGLWGHFSERVRQQAEEAQRRQAQAQQEVRDRDAMLLRGSRMATVSTVSVYSATIVHELSQPLQTVRLALDGARRKLRAEGAPPGVREDVDEALRVIEGTSGFLQSLRNLIRLGTDAREPVALGPCLREILPVLEGEARRRGIGLDVQVDVGEAVAVCNFVMLQRIVFNLVGNAFDALSSQGGERRVRLSAGPTREGDREWIALEVSDTGPGLPPEVAEQLPHPFTTSKPTGLGLGLSLADAAARQWGGRLTLGPADLLAGRGLAVRLLLPPAAPSRPHPLGHPLEKASTP